MGAATTEAKRELPAWLGLDDRGVLAVEGPDRVAFLQGLVSNDVARAGPDRAVWAAFLTPQGKYLHDFIILDAGACLLLDVEAARRDDLLQRLKKYRLRSKVTLSDATDEFAVAAVFGPGAAACFGLPEEPGAAARLRDGGLACTDPRLPALGVRVVAARSGIATIIGATGAEPGCPAAYERLRIAAGVPDGSRDLVAEKSILLENNFDPLHGVSWDKGCYVGQELTARTKYRGLIRKRLLPVAIEGPLPAPGTPVMLDGREAGEMRSGIDGLGLALLRLDAISQGEHSGSEMVSGEARLRPQPPAWWPA